MLKRHLLSVNLHEFIHILKCISFEFIIKSQKLPAMVLAWGNLLEVFVMLVVSSFCFSSFVDVLYSHFLFDIIPHPSLTPHTFIFNHPVIFLPRALRFWVVIFYPQAFFTLWSFLTFLAQPAFIKASLGAGSFSLKFAGLHTDPQNTDQHICLFDLQ